MTGFRFAAALAALTLAPVLVPAASRADDASLSLTVAGVARTYTLHVPPTLAAHVPLILAFHGHGGRGASMERLTKLDELADRDGFIVAYPDGIDHNWNDGRMLEGDTYDDVAFTSALIDALEARYPIDRARVYATGMSNGAIFSEYLACRLADRIAAIAAVAGSLPDADRAACKPDRAISVLQINGTLDPIVPYTGGSVGGFGTRGTVLSVADTVAFWSDRDGCTGRGIVRNLELREPRDGTLAQSRSFVDCRDGSAVVAYAVIGGGHVWPGGPQYASEAIIGKATDQLDASGVIVNFFREHALRLGK